MKGREMASFAGNLSTQITFELRSRGMLIPLIKKTSGISCCRGSHSSGPVRYIPKHSHRKEIPAVDSYKQKTVNHPADSSSFRSVVSEENIIRYQQQSPSERSQTPFLHAERITSPESELPELGEEIDQEWLVADPASIEEFEQLNDVLQISNEDRACENDTIGTSKIKHDAENMAIEALSARALTAVELQKKLHGKKFPHDIIDAVIADLRERGYLNDQLYAESFTRSRWSSLSWGPRRIKQALQRKGVSEAAANNAMKQVFEGGDAGAKQDNQLGMSKVSMDHLLAQALKQWNRGQDVPLETRRSRIIRWLQYRGFNWGVTSFILNKLQSQYPP